MMTKPTIKKIPNDVLELLTAEYPYARNCIYCGSDLSKPSWEGLKQLAKWKEILWRTE